METSHYGSNFSLYCCYTLQEYLQICRKYLISVVMVTVDDIIVGEE